MTEVVPAPAEERVRRNRALLSERFPDLARLLAAAGEAVPVREDGVVVDLDLGQNRLYGSDGRSLAAEQVAGYMEKPLRFFITDLSGANIASQSSFRLFRRLQDELEGRGLGIDDLSARPEYEGCFLIVLGLGLGYHLQELIDRTGAKIVLIVEPHAEFLRHSLEALDWAELIAANEARGCSISVLVPRDASEALRLISLHFTDYGSHFIDGAYVFVHYPSITLLDIRDRLVESVQVLYSSRGYHEDELVMLTNCAANAALGKFRWLDGKLRPERQEPVFIIGSGPSVDKSIEHVKRLRDRAIVFSCGTGLRVCLGNGIVP
ncbi:MAG: 6-hydroxymethylpterin diphosphokinase MptE-like protein, partial [Rhodospirillaceae bacterium]